MARPKSAKSEPIELKNSFEHSIKFKARKFKFTETQRAFLDIALDDRTKIMFVSGPAGSGKTFMSVYGCLQLMNTNAELDLIYVRSIAESADKGLGSLPGDVGEKFDPFMLPLNDKLLEIVCEGDIAHMKAQEKITAIPVNFLRGANWRDKLVIVDEAQNMTSKELTTLITRIGEGTKIIVCGDFMQSDINGRSGFRPMFDLFNDPESKDRGIAAFSFTEDDIVRSEILKFIIRKLSA